MNKSWKCNTSEQMPSGMATNNGFLQNGSSGRVTDQQEATGPLLPAAETVPLATVVHLGGSGAVLYQQQSPPIRQNKLLFSAREWCLVATVVILLFVSIVCVLAITTRTCDNVGCGLYGCIRGYLFFSDCIL